MISARCFEGGGAVVACGGTCVGAWETQLISHDDTDNSTEAELIYHMRFGIM